ncbi:MAG TPA: TraR/DksA C4-type zinc finger protein [Terriglobia bacterium]|jgi:DnaK suppressor protein
MRRAELEGYKELLEIREQELSEGFRTRDLISLQRTSPEPEEEAQMTAEQDLAVQSRNQAAQTLRQVWAALDRIEDGSYGICLSCERAIQPHRLEAVPWAPYCIQCQEIMDQQQVVRASRPREVVELELIPQRKRAA